MQSSPSEPFRPLDFGQLLSRSLALFTDHFAAFLAVSIGPVFAIDAIGLLTEGAHWVTQVLFTVVTLFVYMVVWSATTLLASGGLLHHPPDFATAYRAALRSPIGTLFRSTIVFIVLVTVGLALLIVPGLIVMAQLMLAPAIVVMERRGTWDSLRRSRALGSGFHARNLILIVVLSLPSILLAALAASLEIDNTFLNLVVMAVSSVTQALTVIAAFLAYIDMRARKESLDPTTLALEIGAAYGQEDAA